MPGAFGEYGGQYVPETVMAALAALEDAYWQCRVDEAFQAEMDDLRKHFVGRPTPLFHARSMSADLGCRVYLKREDLCHTGSHKLNNALGQVLLAKRMGKTRIIAGTDAEQGWLAPACASSPAVPRYTGSRGRAAAGTQCGAPGSRVIPSIGLLALKDAIRSLRDWVITWTRPIVIVRDGPSPTT